MEHIARKVLRNAQEMVPGRFSARPVTPQTYPHIAWRDYNAARRRLEALGFRHLGDIEPLDLVVDPALSRANVLRILAAEGGTVMAAFYRLPLRSTVMGMLARFLGGSGGVLDVQTVYADGTVLTTSNGVHAGVWTPPPFQRSEFHPRSMTIEALVARHRERMRERAAAAPEVQPVALHSLDDVIAACDRSERAKRSFRESIGWVTRDELARFGRLSGEQLDQLDHAVRILVASEG